MNSLSLTRKQIVLLAILVESGLGVLAVLGGWALGAPVATWVRLSIAGLLWGVGGGAVLLAILGLCRLVSVGPIAKLMRLVDAHVSPLFRDCRVLDLLLISVLAGVGEELLFRGLVQGWLDGCLSAWFGASAGRWTAVGLTSVAFGFAHCISREYTVFATALGFLLGALAVVTGDLLAPIVAHAAYDFFALLILTNGHRKLATSNL